MSACPDHARGVGACRSMTRAYYGKRSCSKASRPDSPRSSCSGSARRFARPRRVRSRRPCWVSGRRRHALDGRLRYRPRTGEDSIGTRTAGKSAGAVIGGGAVAPGRSSGSRGFSKRGLEREAALIGEMLKLRFAEQRLHRLQSPLPLPENIRCNPIPPSHKKFSPLSFHVALGASLRVGDPRPVKKKHNAPMTVSTAAVTRNRLKFSVRSSITLSVREPTAVPTPIEAIRKL